MSLSEAQWLDLREMADARARNGAVAEALRAWFLQRPMITVVDLSGDLGANLRATAPLLPHRQRWLVISPDLAIEAATRERLSLWAEASEKHGAELHLSKGAARIEVSFGVASFTEALDTVLGADARADLITASAAFEQASAKLVRRFTSAADRMRAAVYIALTANGLVGWTPRHPSDREMLAAYHRFQMRDCGAGPAAGPTAAIELSEALTAQGFSVIEGESPWRLGPGDAPLLAAFKQRFAAGVAESGAQPMAGVDAWLKRSKSGAEVGHADLFATPPSGKGVRMDADED